MICKCGGCIRIDKQIDTGMIVLICDMIDNGCEGWGYFLDNKITWFDHGNYDREKYPELEKLRLKLL